jgi:hypothetical protein
MERLGLRRVTKHRRRSQIAVVPMNCKAGGTPGPQAGDKTQAALSICGGAYEL